MEIIQDIVGGLVAAPILAFGAVVIRNRARTRQSFRAVLRGTRRLRVSMSALLKIEADDRYLLIRQGPHRPFELGPIGGVYKKLGSGVPTKLDFRHRRSDDPDRDGDLSNDLRGTIPAYRLPAFLKWFESRRGRESDALHRELAEELLNDIGLDALPPGLVPLQTEFLYKVEEGPLAVRDDVPVYRRHEIYRLHGDIGRLLELAHQGGDLRLVSSDEIRRGQTNDRTPIGDHTAYLLGQKRLEGSRGL